MENGFFKASEPVYTGIEKAAVLLCEVSSVEEVYRCLDLTDLEKNKLRKAIQRLGRYDANNPLHVAREQTVLKEALAIGAKKGILSNLKVVPAEERDRNKDLWTSVKNEPDKIAKILGLWLDEKEGK